MNMDMLDQPSTAVKRNNQIHHEVCALGQVIAGGAAPLSSPADLHLHGENPLLVVSATTGSPA